MDTAMYWLVARASAVRRPGRLPEGEIVAFPRGELKATGTTPMSRVRARTSTRPAVSARRTHPPGQLRKRLNGR
jgi:hypothetical protein